MAAIVCHGLQSHLESQLVEPRTLMFRLPSTKPIDLAFHSCFWTSNNIKTQLIQMEEEEKPIISSNTMSGWSFLDALSNVSQCTKEPSKQIEEEAIYVHPQQKRSSMSLSAKSLQLCTENLGSESGTDIVENGIDMFSSLGEQGRQEQEQPRQHRKAKKAKTTANFPPPLTTIRGSESLRVRPHREDGRLVIEVTRVPPTASCFQAERSNGRLRLCFSNIHHPSFDPQGEDDDDDVDQVEENEPTTNEEVHNIEEEDKKEVETEDGKTEEIKTEDGKTEEIKTEEEEGDFACGCDVMRTEKLEIEMPRRCNEGGGDHHHEKLINNWVVTS